MAPRFPEYVDPSNMTLRQLAKAVKGGDNIKGKVVLFPVSELGTIRDYTWSRAKLRRGIVPLGPPGSDGCPDDWSDPLEGPDRWDALVDWTKKYGWTCDPAHVDVGRDGRVKLAEGNHRLAIAETLGIKAVPTQFHVVDSPRKTAPLANEPRQLARFGKLPKSGRIPTAQVQRAMKALGRKVKACRITPALLREGMEVEREHRDVTGLAVVKTAKIAASHLCERRDYYKRIKRYVEPRRK